MRRLLPAAFLLVAGCGIFDAISGESPRDALRRHQESWVTLGIHDYDFDYQLSCFCATESLEPVRIEVRGDLVSRVTSRRTGLVIDAVNFVSWPTIDSLFIWTDRNFDQKYRLGIHYDPNHAFPAYVSGDIPGAIDDEFTRTADSFARR